MRNNIGKSFVAIMIVIAVMALLLRIVIEKAIKWNIAQNESYAQSTLKLVSTALENYAKDNRGAYPTSLSVLTLSTPSYLDIKIIAQTTQRGYIYACPRMETSGYSCMASPVKCGLTGKAAYTITTGSLLVLEECSKQE